MKNLKNRLTTTASRVTLEEIDSALWWAEWMSDNGYDDTPSYAFDGASDPRRSMGADDQATASAHLPIVIGEVL